MKADDRELSGAIDRYFLSSFLETISFLTPNTKTFVKEAIAEMMNKEDPSTLNKFLAGTTQSLTPEIWQSLNSDSFGPLEHVIYNGITPEDFISLFNAASKIRYMYLPFTYVDSDKSDEAELFRKIAKWSRDLIKAIWGKPDEALDVEYWAKIIELLPLSLHINREYLTSLCYQEDTVQQMIKKLEERTTYIENIPFGILGELKELESYIHRYNKKYTMSKDTANKGTMNKDKSEDFLEKLEKQKTSLIRLKAFADCSGIFRLYSIRPVDIRLYSRIYCLPKDEQLNAKNALSNVTAVCEQMGTTLREPDME